MNTTATVDEVEEVEAIQEKPGAQLAAARKQKGYSPEYVAGKLHLRVRVIELLEADEYENMPEPVFIKGYLRAYAKLLGIDPEPIVTTFNGMFSMERKFEKTLWQTRRESNKAAYIVRWLTIILAVGVLIAVGMWWHKNKDVTASLAAATNVAEEKSGADIRLTDLSKMRSLLSTNGQVIPLEKQGG